MSPGKQRHRGQHQEDARLFAPAQHVRLREGVRDLSWLCSRGYATKTALTLVGDHYQFHARQRTALQRAACSDASLQHRREHCIPSESLHGEALVIDGYNLLITAESALSGGILILSLDGCVRDMASLHSSYHKIEETLPALMLIGGMLQQLEPGAVTWYFDAPVSNSGRLKQLLQQIAQEQGWNWRVELTQKTDHCLAASEEIVVSADSWVLDRAARWTNLGRRLIESVEPTPVLIDLSS